MPTPDYVSIYQDLAAKIFPSKEIINRIFNAWLIRQDPGIKFDKFNTGIASGIIEMENLKYAFDIKFENFGNRKAEGYVPEYEVLFWASADHIESF